LQYSLISAVSPKCQFTFIDITILPLSLCNTLLCSTSGTCYTYLHYLAVPYVQKWGYLGVCTSNLTSPFHSHDCMLCNYFCLFHILPLLTNSITKFWKDKLEKNKNIIKNHCTQKQQRFPQKFCTYPHCLAT
jgi:hypothetical protein